MLKYNFQEMQIEFLKWQRDTVESYLSQKQVKRNWFVSKSTRWRYDTKQEIKKQAVEESKKKIQDTLVITNDELRQMKKNAFSLVKARLSQLAMKMPKKNEDWSFTSGDDIPTRDITDLIKTIKVELLEPTVINKVEWLNDNWFQIFVDWSVWDLLKINKDDKISVQTDSEAKCVSPDTSET